jgi:hypothetical protein
MRSTDDATAANKGYKPTTDEEGHPDATRDKGEGPTTFDLPVSVWLGRVTACQVSSQGRQETASAATEVTTEAKTASAAKEATTEARTASAAAETETQAQTASAAAETEAQVQTASAATEAEAEVKAAPAATKTEVEAAAEEE